MDTLLNDLRSALRALRRRPVFTALAVLTLALGTGANVAIFSVVYGTLLRPLPFHEADRLLLVRGASDAGRHPRATPIASLAWPEVLDLRAGAPSLGGVAAFSFATYDVTGGAEAQQVRSADVTGNFFEVLGFRPQLGRGFTPEESRGEGARVVVIGPGVWQRQFGGRTDAVGRSLRLDGTPYTVVGVVTEPIAWPEWADLAIPAAEGKLPADRTQRTVSVLARLAPGRQLPDAARELELLGARFAKAYPASDAGRTLQLTPLTDEIVGAFRPLLVALLGAVGLILLLACSTVAQMLLARAAEREREMAVRVALGAPRTRLVRQLLVESGILAALGAGLGLVIARVTLPALLALAPQDLPRNTEIVIDRPVYLFALAVALASAVLFGLVPALRASRVDVQQAVKEAGGGTTTARSAGRLRAVLVTTQVALATVLLAGAGLFLRSFAVLLGVDPGYDPKPVAVSGIVLPDYLYDSDRSVGFFRDFRTRAAAMPGVAAAAAVNFPHAGGGFSPSKSRAAAEGSDPSRGVPAQVRVVTPGYFAALRIPLRSGRDFTPQDGPGARLAVVNERFAALVLGGGQVVGRRFTMERQNQLPVTAEIVGVVADVRNAGRLGTPEPEIYYTHAQVPWGYMNFVVRAKDGVPAQGMLPVIEAAVRELDPARSLFSQAALEEWVSGEYRPARFGATLLGAFAVVAVVLASAGLYGVLAYVAQARAREVSIRLALGASTRDLVRLLVAPAARQVLTGLAVGLAGAVLLARAAADSLRGISPSDPLVFGGVPVLVLAVAAIASLLPVRRMISADPASALRAE